MMRRVLASAYTAAAAESHFLIKFARDFLRDIRSGFKREKTASKFSHNQCCGSGSAGSAPHVLGLQDPDPLVRGTDPARITQNFSKKLNF